jgi:hypothetical protein
MQEMDRVSPSGSKPLHHAEDRFPQWTRPIAWIEGLDLAIALHHQPQANRLPPPNGPLRPLIAFYNTAIEISHTNVKDQDGGETAVDKTRRGTCCTIGRNPYN